MSDIKAMLFDFDGTLADTNKIIVNAWNALAMTTTGHGFPEEETAKYFGTPLEDAIEGAMNKFGIEGYTVEECVDIYRGYQFSHAEDYSGTFPGIPDVLAALKEKGILLGIVTSRINNSVRDYLKECDIEKYFEYLVVAESTQIHKPDPYPAILCCEKLGVKPSEAIMVGDSVHDIACGNRAGCKTIMVGWSYCAKSQDLTGDGKPTYWVTTAADLLKYV